MTRVRVLYWQDIPSVIRAGDAKRQLPYWFQQEIDRLAMEQGLLGSDEYLAQWQWRDLGDRDGEAAAVLDAVEAELTAAAGRSASPG